ncbi:hypothetical protein SEA_SPEEDDEMON_1260 [Gordonia phage SpeedDemon]|nr:hypothetical protein SEA_SPEEDDEMON_1260 [Gordonia phage SpeedDemon]
MADEKPKHPHCIKCLALTNRWGGVCMDCQLGKKGTA